MQRMLPPDRSMPLFDVASTRAIEERMAAASAPHALMRRAGAAVARLAMAVAPHAERVWIAAGSGNNGGDGFEAAVHLLASRRQVHVTLRHDAARLPSDAADAFQRARHAGVTIDARLPLALGPDDLVIDALLGIGVRGAPRPDTLPLIDAINAADCRVLAIDVPSGLDADMGHAEHACVRAHHTLALLTLKPGLFTGSGRDQAGEVWLDTLGADDLSDAPDAWLTGTAVNVCRPRRHAQHKGSFGDVAIVAGAHGMAGAAMLASRAAHAAGAGRVYASPLDDDAPLHDAMRPELLFRRAWWRERDEVLARTTVVCGCGGGDAVRSVLPRLLGGPVPRLVLDADALNAIAADTGLQALLRARGGRGHATVLTPHPLEAARLLGITTLQLQADRLGAAQALAQRTNAVVVLKGSGTVIASPSRAPFINPTGNASLATAGTGDVLAGWLGGQWAQRGTADAFDAACASVFTHGAAADAAGLSVIRAADLIEAMRRVGRAG